MFLEILFVVYFSTHLISALLLSHILILDYEKNRRLQVHALSIKDVRNDNYPQELLLFQPQLFLNDYYGISLGCSGHALRQLWLR